MAIDPRWYRVLQNVHKHLRRELSAKGEPKPAFADAAEILIGDNEEYAKRASEIREAARSMDNG